MEAPPAMTIENAATRLLAQASAGTFIDERTAQMLELSEAIGDDAAKKLGITGLSDDFRRGYELGLETARVVIEANPFIDHSKIDF